jgi:hypothetical protein
MIFGKFNAFVMPAGASSTSAGGAIGGRSIARPNVVSSNARRPGARPSSATGAGSTDAGPRLVGSVGFVLVAAKK